MTKKQTVAGAEQPPETLDAPPASPVAPAADAEPFTLGQWHDFVRYRCTFCKWDTGHEGLAWQHYAERHGPGADSDEEE